MRGASISCSSTETTTPDEDTDDAATGDQNGYDPELYAPGAGQEPAPTPNPPGGGNNNGVPNNVDPN